MAEHDLDFVALFIEKPVSLSLVRPCRVGRDDRFGFLGPDGLKNGIAVIGTIGEHGLGFDPVDQTECFWRIAGLASSQAETERVAERITGSMQLAVKTATRAAKSLISFVFFALAAQSLARTTVLSSSCRASLGSSTGVLPLVTTCFGPRTEAAGLTGIT